MHHSDSKLIRSVLFIISITLFILLGGCQKKRPAEPKSGEGGLSWLHTEGNRILNESDEDVVLRGVNRSGLEYDLSGNGMSQTEIIYICQNWRAQIVRIPFNQDWIMRNATYLPYLDQVIEWVTNEGAYALLDLQWENTDVGIPNNPNLEAVYMWQMLAARYSQLPGVLYDIHNEAHNTSWDAWRQRASQIVEAIQEVHPDALIFVCGLDWAYDLRGWEAEPLLYTNIVYSSHPYPFKGQPWAWHEYFGNLAETHPVFLGEFGGEEADLEWGRQLLEYFDEKGLGWTAWSWVDNPRLTEADRRTPTAFGELVYNALVEHATVN